MSLTWRRSRITGAGLVAAQYDLTLERQTIMDNVLFIPGIANPVSEINQLLFSQGQPGGGWIPSFSQAMIAANSFGGGVTDILDLSGNNNPFSQATPSSRGAWFREPKSGRRNLLTHTESITVGNGWTISGTGVVKDYGSEGSGIEITRTVAGAGFGISAVRTVALTGATTGLQHTFQIRLRRVSGPTTIAIRTVEEGGASVSEGGDSADFTLTSEFQTVSFTYAISKNDRTGLRFFVQSRAAGDYVVDTVRPQQEVGSTATAYQRVTTAFDVTEAGQRDCFGVRADGIDDGYATGSIDFTGTPNITIFAAVRKRSDAATGFIVELGPNFNTTDSSFGLNGPGSPGVGTYGLASRGTSLAFVIPGTFTAPITNILTGICSIAAPVVTLRVNGTQAGTTTNSQGTGTYRNDILHLFRRNSTTSPFNGDLYALIVAGGSYPLSTIQRVERILSRITPTVNL